jgi:four helix bundle protein
MNHFQMRQRTMHFAVRAVKWCRTLPRTWEARQIGGQLIASATSIAINYRACGRSRSRADFINKVGVVVEETDESAGWLELSDRLELSPGDEHRWLTSESDELLRIFAASLVTAKEGRRRELEKERAVRQKRTARSKSVDP